MISIRRYLAQSAESPPEEQEFLQACLRVRRSLEDGMPSQNESGPEMVDFEDKSQDILCRLEDAASPTDVVLLTGDALEFHGEYRRRLAQYYSEQGAHLQSMIAMLTNALADISGQSDASVARLLIIERGIEQASRLDDIRVLKSNLEQCLTEIREAVVQQRSAGSSTVERLRESIRVVPVKTESPVAKNEALATDFVAVLRLQRSDYIADRFGETVRDQMLAVIGESLKAVATGEDRIMRWKGPSFVVFLKSAEGLLAVRRRIAQMVNKIGQRYVEVGKNSALLAVSVDWAAYPQARFSSMDAVFAEIDAFLARNATGRMTA
jgi:GGDEF domain-containing protein